MCMLLLTIYLFVFWYLWYESGIWTGQKRFFAA